MIHHEVHEGREAYNAAIIYMGLCSAMISRRGAEALSLQRLPSFSMAEIIYMGLCSGLLLGWTGEGASPTT
jgi:hypothetical protein